MHEQRKESSWLKGASGSWVAVAAWMAVIFTLSSIPDLRSGLQPLWDLILRKIAHALEYAVLGWLSVRALETSGVGRNRAVAWGVIASVLYAVSDEFHQAFIPGREGSPWDVLIDGIGVLFGIGVLLRLRTP